ncbi:hypothetical protein GII30_01400 [Gordonia amarae]|uniref:AbiEi antitoxin C-terminal domain-containing protein n=2 Tax=Gordonia amarae TaxID=36821 RepID=G7GRS5_9ACTN|nr:type IV toxin-antitoxin system AbiEi family antitoxin domain-containing protein [Gordonia amarae]MCS3877002.1 hypothetical protein [Gordonia amarae]QHN15822.1 hypothetical protein GII35_01400 [Gordonia amarae]QHN20390.1 hypothetical protein GII34_01400 [Gordonia amarae]QHN29242.1 hypothetical protein GII32_01405 [Gordonia amarae]QHN38021.1 hypothetical protein GII30_01400 [Gordonia amarae]
MTSALDELLQRQDGVIARPQAVDLGLSPNEIRRKLRRRDWTATAPGVYVRHTGPLTSKQREWVAVLHAWPAALSHSSAICAAGGDTQPDGPIHVAIDAERRVVDDHDIVVHRIAGMNDRVLWTASPPRMRIEEAVLDVASSATRPERAIACLSDAVQSRSTTADRLLAALDSRPRIRLRGFLRGVLIDVRDGTCSVLEHHYLTKMERRHQLPRPHRQSRTTLGRPGFRDLEYSKWGVVVELDGRMAHDSATARAFDMERDLDAAVDGNLLTLRIGYRQVVGRPCATTHKVAKALRNRGWQGTPTRCPQCPPT